MKKFIHATDADYAELEQAAKETAYLNFRDVELPPGCVPPRTRVGLSIENRSGRTKLFIQHGVRYYGAVEGVRQWVDHGEISFPSFKEFRCFISSDLARAFAQGQVPKQPSIWDRGPAQP